MFVADFLGSPPMNFLHFTGAAHAGERAVRINGAQIDVPEVREDRAQAPLALGVRPEHVTLCDESALRGRVFGAEYLGTTQIVTIDTAHGRLKARVPSSVRLRTGENVGLRLRADCLALFDAGSGRALRSALYDGAPNG
jgi:multiple sugar transport system ATP-binding protein